MYHSSVWVHVNWGELVGISNSFYLLFEHNLYPYPNTSSFFFSTLSINKCGYCDKVWNVADFRNVVRTRQKQLTYCRGDIYFSCLQSIHAAFRSSYLRQQQEVEEVKQFDLLCCWVFCFLLRLWLDFTPGWVLISVLARSPLDVIRIIRE